MEARFFLAAAGLVAARRTDLDPNVFRLLFAALLVGAASGWASAMSGDSRGFLDVFTHFSEILAFYLIYKAFLVEGVTKPLNVFLKNQQQSESKYRSLFESSTDAIMTIEPPLWNFTAGNPATVAMFRLKSGRTLTTLGPWDVSPARQPDGRASGEKAMEMIATALRDGSRFFEWTHKRIDGEEFPATVLMTKMEQGGKVLILATVRDVTEQKRAEEVLRRAQPKSSGSMPTCKQCSTRRKSGFCWSTTARRSSAPTTCLPRSSGRNRA